MQIELKLDAASKVALAATNRHINTLNRRMSQAINRAGFDSRRLLLRQWRRQLDRVSSYTARGLRYFQARPGPNPTGKIVILPQQWRWLRWQIEGGTARFPRGRRVRIKVGDRVLRRHDGSEVPDRRRRFSNTASVKLKSGSRLLIGESKQGTTGVGFLIKSARYKKRASGEEYLRRVAPRLVRARLNEQLRRRR